jgi:hypothetical protein
MSIRAFLVLVAVPALAACGQQRDTGAGTGGTGGRAGTGGGGAATAGSGGGGAGGSGGSGVRDAGGQATDGGAGDTAVGALEPYFPVAVGNSWTYRVQPVGAPMYMKVQTMERMEPVGGNGPNATKMAIYTVTKKMAGALQDQTVSWQGLEEGMGGAKMVVRYREQAFQAGSMTVNAEYVYQPYQLRLDESPANLAEGVTRMQSYTQSKTEPGLLSPLVTQQTDNWIIESTGETVTVPAGTFSNCLRFKKYGNIEDSGKTFWYCRGVGKVKEQPPATMGQLEELAAYTVK